MRIAFLDNFLNIRGTSVALFDYAHFNETLLGNSSIIITRPYEINSSDNIDVCQEVHNKFKHRFPVFYYTDNTDIQSIIDNQHVDLLYIIKSGEPWDGLHSFQNVKTFIHCVFNTTQPHGDYFTCISPWLNMTCHTNVPILPHMIYLPNVNDNLRNHFNIPENAIIFGRHGGYNQFDNQDARNAVQRLSLARSDIYFIFMNTPEFCHSPNNNIIYVDRSSDVIFKTKFINTCDAMIYGRNDGETFGLSIGEFSIRNKPIFAPKHTNGAKMHQMILKDNAYWFENEDDLYQQMVSFDPNEAKVKDWNMYKFVSPENVMQIFNNIITSDSNHVV